MLKIISGGQTGADRAALDAWSSLGFPTGGWAPLGFRTDNGRDVSLKALGLQETEEYRYEFRTAMNVSESNATLIFGHLDTPGCKLTSKLCDQYHKPIMWWEYPTKTPDRVVIDNTIRFIRGNGVSILNVAGNRESKNPGIYQYVKSIMTNIGREMSK